MHSIGSNAIERRASTLSVSPVKACITPRSCQTVMPNPLFGIGESRAEAAVRARDQIRVFVIEDTARDRA